MKFIKAKVPTALHKFLVTQETPLQQQSVAGILKLLPADNIYVQIMNLLEWTPETMAREILWPEKDKIELPDGSIIAGWPNIPHFYENPSQGIAEIMEILVGQAPRELNPAQIKTLLSYAGKHVDELPENPEKLYEKLLEELNK